MNENGVTYLVECTVGTVRRAHHSDLCLYKETLKYILNHSHFQELHEKSGGNGVICEDQRAPRVSLTASNFVNSSESESKKIPH